VKQEHVPDQASHGPSLGITLSVFAALMVLTGVTVAVAYQDLGRYSAVVALAIAAVKATLVVLYFMHIRYASKLVALYAASGFLFLAILLGITMGEVAGRAPQPSVDPLAPKIAPKTGPSPRQLVEEPP
jgi:cytochrome c oxidase subunit IV